MKAVYRNAVNNGKAFLFGSLLTIWSGHALDNTYIEAGGVGLAVGALMVNREKYKYVPPTLLVANAALTMNGIILAGSGHPLAGLLLASSNSIGGYGLANLLQLFNRISPQTHGVMSAVAGAQIASAGALLGDPVLMITGGLFVIDGVDRGLPPPAVNRQEIHP